MEERSRYVANPMLLDHLRQDVAYAGRQFVRAKGYTAVVVLMLAFGIGATTAIYSAVDIMILNPIPGTDSERLVQVGEWGQFTHSPQPHQGGLSPPAVVAMLQLPSDVFEEVATCDSLVLDRRGTEFDTPISGMMVSENFFQLTGQRPRLGRTFVAGEAVDVNVKPGQLIPSGSLVLSHTVWTSEFGGDPAIVGQKVELGGTNHTVVGVMPPHFRFPAGAGFWLAAKPRLPQTGVVHVANAVVLARLRPGISASEVQPVLDTVAQRLLTDYSASDRSYGGWWRRSKLGLKFWCAPLREVLQTGLYSPGFAHLQRTLFGLLAAIGFILAIVCANVANLALARTEERQHELAVRAALGAGRGRLTRQLLTESLLLALMGGLAGLAVAHGGIRFLAALNNLPQFRPMAVDGRMLAVSLVVSLGCGLVCGLFPALQGSRQRINESLAQGAFVSSASRRGRNVRNLLVVIEVALAVVLLVGAGLMITSVVKLLDVDPGYDAAQLYRLQPQWGIRSGITGQTQTAAVTQLHEQLSAMPGVDAVGVFTQRNTEKLLPEGAADPVLMQRVYVGIENADLFKASGVPLVSGRLLDRSDIGEKVGTIVINRTLAEMCWPNEDPLGKKLSIAERPEIQFRVVGVVGDMLMTLDEVPPPTFYRPYQGAGMAALGFQYVVRSPRAPSDLVPALHQTLHAFNPAMRRPVIRVFQDMLYESTRSRRVYRNYLVTFAGVGLLLSALGIYGVLSYSVARRTREIGIRMALGADRPDVLRMVVGEGARLVAVGLALGLLLAFWLTQLLRTQLYNVAPTDPIVLVVVVSNLAAVALVAAFLPARRAAAVNPIDALKL